MTETTIVEMLVLAPPEQWEASKFNLLQRLMVQAIKDEEGIENGEASPKASPKATSSSSSSSSSAPVGDKDVYAGIRPAFLFFGLVDKLFEVLSKHRSWTRQSATSIGPPPGVGGKRKLSLLSSPSESSSEDSSKGLTASEVIQQRQHVTRYCDMELLGELELYLKQFNSALIPCKCLQDYIGVLGLKTAIEARGISEAEFASRVVTSSVVNSGSTT